MQILAVSGSLRAGSYNSSLLRAAADVAPDGVVVELLDPEVIAALPLYDEGLDAGAPPAAAARLRRAVESADAVLFATPEYNGSVPGGLKNAVDWASRPAHGAVLANKTVAVAGASTGRFGARWAQADLRRILGIAGARVVGDDVPVARAHERFDARGRLLDGELRERLRRTLETLAAEASFEPAVAA